MSWLFAEKEKAEKAHVDEKKSQESGGALSHLKDKLLDSVGLSSPIEREVETLSLAAHAFAAELGSPDSKLVFSSNAKELWTERATGMVAENSPAIDKAWAKFIEPAVHARQTMARMGAIRIAGNALHEVMRNQDARRPATEIEANFWQNCSQLTGLSKDDDQYAQNAFENKAPGMAMSLSAALEQAKQEDASAGIGGEEEAEQAPTVAAHSPKPKKQKVQAPPKAEEQLKKPVEDDDPSDENIIDSTDVRYRAPARHGRHHH